MKKKRKKKKKVPQIYILVWENRSGRVGTWAESAPVFRLLKFSPTIFPQTSRRGGSPRPSHAQEPGQLHAQV